MSNFQKPVFSTKINGYNRDEVDSYIVPLLAKQNALIAENDSLKKQLLEALTTLQPAKENAERIRNAANEAERKAAHIVENAQQQAQTLLLNAKNACDAEIASYKEAVAQEMALFDELRKLILSFNELATKQYRSQLESLEKNAKAMTVITQQSGEDFEKRILKRMKEQMTMQKQQKLEATEAQRRAATPAAPAEPHRSKSSIFSDN